MTRHDHDHDHDHDDHGHHDHGPGDHRHGGDHDRGGDHDHDPGGDHDHRVEHAHAHHHHSHAQGQATRTLLIALVLTAGFMFIEAVVGFMSGSLALVADAGHMLADAAALGLALSAQRFASRPRTDRSTFGFRRAEVLAAFVNGMALSGVAVLILKEAVERWLEPQAIDGRSVAITAVAGLAVNLVVATILMRGHKHNLNVRAALAHVLTDALGSVAAIVSGVSVWMWGAYRADPLLSAGIAVLVFVSGWRVIKETVGILLESAPPHLDVAAIERTIRACPGVTEVHDLHVWRISDQFDALTAHVVLERGSHGTEVCRSVAARLKSVHGLEHVTIQPESPRPDDVVRVRRSRDGAPLRHAG